MALHPNNPRSAASHTHLIVLALLMLAVIVLAARSASPRVGQILTKSGTLVQARANK